MDSIDVGDMLGAMDDWIESAWPWELATISIWIRTDAEVTVMITSDGWTRSVFATLARIRLVTCQQSEPQRKRSEWEEGHG
jgi:hypothetical protein